MPRGRSSNLPARETRIWTSEGSTAWTVVYEDDPPGFRVSCLNRFALCEAGAPTCSARCRRRRSFTAASRTVGPRRK